MLELYHSPISTCLQKVRMVLAETGWIASDQFTLADVSVMPTVVRMEDLGPSC